MWRVHRGKSKCISVQFSQSISLILSCTDQCGERSYTCAVELAGEAATVGGVKEGRGMLSMAAIGLGGGADAPGAPLRGRPTLI